LFFGGKRFHSAFYLFSAHQNNQVIQIELSTSASQNKRLRDQLMTASYRKAKNKKQKKTLSFEKLC
jgi:hypothetical protein